MNKKTGIIVAVLLLIVILGIGAFVLTKSSKSKQVQKTQTTAEPTKVQSQQVTEGTLESLLKNSKPLKCTFSTKTGESQVDGVVYAANKKVRGDYKTTVNKINYNGHIIVDSDYSYIWSDMNNEGMKMLIVSPTQQQKTASSSPSNSQGLDINQKVNYSCQDWKEDNSMFSLPSNIKFTTLSIPTIAPSSASGSQTQMQNNTNQCATCDNLPAGQARDLCRTQLRCQ